MPPRFLPFLFLFFTTVSAAIAQTVVHVWDGPAPQSHGTTPNDIPTLTVFLPENTSQPTSAIVICPGGAYSVLVFDTEGVNEAKWFQQRGVAAFVLKYRLPVNGYRHPVPLLDVQRAIRLVRSHSVDWNIDTSKVGVMGFSAGGHLASTVDTHFDAGNAFADDPVERLSCRPDFAVLVYPVISMKDGITHADSKANLLGPNPDPKLVESLSNETQVTPQTPPTLLIHAEDDGLVPIENSRLMYAALQKAGVRSAFQEYPHGGHGFGFGPNQNNAPPGWLDKAYNWLRGQDFMP
jgi:acetyl esterase/lipase